MKPKIEAQRSASHRIAPLAIADSNTNKHENSSSGATRTSGRQEENRNGRKATLPLNPNTFPCCQHSRTEKGTDRWRRHSSMPAHPARVVQLGRRAMRWPNFVSSFATRACAPTLSGQSYTGAEGLLGARRKLSLGNLLAGRRSDRRLSLNWDDATRLRPICVPCDVSRVRSRAGRAASGGCCCGCASLWNLVAAVAAAERSGP